MEKHDYDHFFVFVIRYSIVEASVYIRMLHGNDTVKPGILMI